MQKYNIGDIVIFYYYGEQYIGSIEDIYYVVPSYYYRIIPFEGKCLLMNVLEQNIERKVGSEKENQEMKSNMCEIVDYKIFNDNKVVVVCFADGTEERAVRDDRDAFDLERAIEVCCMKKLLGGSAAYNKLIHKAVNQVKAIDKKRVAEKEEAERLAKKRQKDIEAKIKRKEKKRQEQVEIQKEAYLKAMLEYNEKVLDNFVYK